MNMVSISILAAGLTLASGLAQAATGKDATVGDIQACMDRNLADRAALRDLSVTVHGRDAKSHALRMKLYWKPGPKKETRLHIKLKEPAAIRGSSYLMLQSGAQEEVYFWLPSASNALRITGQNTAEPLWGTDFSYGEIKQVLGLMVGGDTLRQADGSIGGRKTYVLETRTRLEDSGYSRVVSQVDQASCTLLRSEFFAKDATPRKRLEAKLESLIQADKYWAILDYTMHDLRAGSRTELSLSDFTLEERLPDRLFEPKRFFEPFE